MSKKEIKGEILEAKVFPCCGECDHLLTGCKGLFKKKWLFGCSAQGFQSTAEVYGSENCKGNYINQLGR